MNRGPVGLFKYDLEAKVFGDSYGTTATSPRTVFTIVGVAGLICVPLLVNLVMAQPFARDQSRTMSGPTKRQLDDSRNVLAFAARRAGPQATTAPAAGSNGFVRTASE